MRNPLIMKKTITPIAGVISAIHQKRYGLCGFRPVTERKGMRPNHQERHYQTNGIKIVSLEND
jgi:hypothetical protein